MLKSSYSRSRLFSFVLFEGLQKTLVTVTTTTVTKGRHSYQRFAGTEDGKGVVKICKDYRCKEKRRNPEFFTYRDNQDWCVRLTDY